MEAILGRLERIRDVHQQYSEVVELQLSTLFAEISTITPRQQGSQNESNENTNSNASSRRGVPRRSVIVNNNPRAVPNASRGALGNNRAVPTASRGALGNNRAVPTASRGALGNNRAVPTASRGALGNNRAVPTASRGALGSNRAIRRPNDENRVPRTRRTIPLMRSSGTANLMIRNTSTTSRKMRDFSVDPICEKTVDKIPGIGPRAAARLSTLNYVFARRLLGKFLETDKEEFLEFLKTEALVLPHNAEKAWKSLDDYRTNHL